MKRWLIQERLRQLVEEFRKVCKRKKLRENKTKSEIIKCIRMANDRRMNLNMHGKLLEEVQCFKCLRLHMLLLLKR